MWRSPSEAHDRAMFLAYDTVKHLVDQRISELRRTRHTPAFRQGDRYRWFW
jgi:hypothetical protein